MAAAKLAMDHGLINAVNLDGALFKFLLFAAADVDRVGGGSTTAYFDGKVINELQDLCGKDKVPCERVVTTIICIK